MLRNGLRRGVILQWRTRFGVRQQSSMPLAPEKKKIGTIGSSEALKANDKIKENIRSDRARKGFSNVNKVPSTMDLEPKHILLDKLYQGYQPLMLPHSPDMLQDSNGKKPFYINILEGIALEEYEKDIDTTAAADEAYHTPTMLISKYIFNKNPETEKSLEALGESSAEPETPLNSKIKTVGNMFSTRKQNNKHGRLRINFSKKTKGDHD